MARTKDRARQEPRQEMKAGSFQNSTEKTLAKSLLFRTATYARLSVDSAVTESDSITSQQLLMRDFLKGRDEFFLVREYKEM